MVKNWFIFKIRNEERGVSRGREKGFNSNGELLIELMFTASITAE